MSNAGDSAFASAAAGAIAPSPFVEGPAEAVVHHASTAPSPFVAQTSESFSEVIPVVDHAAKVAEALLSVGAAESEIAKIKELAEHEIESIHARVVSAIEAGEEAVKSELDKLRTEFHIGPAPVDTPVTEADNSADTGDANTAADDADAQVSGTDEADTTGDTETPATEAVS